MNSMLKKTIAQSRRSINPAESLYSRRANAAACLSAF